VNLAPGQETDVGVHAEVCADERLHVVRPAKSGGIDQPLNMTVAGRNHVDLNTTGFTVLGILDWSEQNIIICHCKSPPLMSELEQAVSLSGITAALVDPNLNFVGSGASLPQVVA